MAKNTGKVREFCQSRKVGTLIYVKESKNRHWVCQGCHVPGNLVSSFFELGKAQSTINN